MFQTVDRKRVCGKLPFWGRKKKGLKLIWAVSKYNQYQELHSKSTLHPDLKIFHIVKKASKMQKNCKLSQHDSPYGRKQLHYTMFRT